MPRIALTGGAYQARSVIVSAQRSLNLFAEPLPEIAGEKTQWAHYPTPGLVHLGTLPQGNVRGIHQTPEGRVYVVAGSGVYRVDPNSWTGTHLGDITPGLHTPVSMADNGQTMVIVDGSTGGWTVDVTTDAFATIVPASDFGNDDKPWKGADRVEVVDTFFIFNSPSGPSFYWSKSVSTDFDPLDTISKEGSNDWLVTIAVAKLEIWLLGQRTTEIFYDVGQTTTADLQFARQQGVFIDQGCIAQYSVAVYDDAVYWLGANRAGQGIVFAGQNYQARRISTYAIEAHLTTLPRIDDAIGFTYSLGGHAFYVLTFPAADQTWVYDITTEQWHEWLWIDTNGVEHRHRANCCAYIQYWGLICGDWENGNLYHIDPAAHTDNGQPIKRQRSFPHIVNEMDRVFYQQFIADIESGNPAGDPEAGVRTLEQTSFTAPDGTLLSAYSNTADTNAAWALVSGTEAAITDGELTGPSGGGSSLYQSPIMAAADYTLQFQVIPSGYATASTGSLFAIARSTGVGTGYRATVAGDGTQYHLTLDVEGGGASSTLAMGTLASGQYAVTMVLQGTHITATAQRSSDGQFLQPGGVWAAANVPALTLTDGTYAAPGRIMIGGSW